MIKPTSFTSADMVLLIVLTRKVKQWKNKFLKKEGDYVFDIRNLTNKLRQQIKRTTIMNNEQSNDDQKIEGQLDTHVDNAVVTIQEGNELKSSGNRLTSSKAIFDDERNQTQDN